MCKEQGVIAQNKNSEFQGNIISALTGFPYSSEEKFTLTDLKQAEHKEDADSTNFITATAKYSKRSLIKYIFTDNQDQEKIIVCGEKITVYDESKQNFIPISELAQQGQSFQQHDQIFTFKSSEEEVEAETYMIEVKDMHHFYANGILVHNPKTPADEAEEARKAEEILASLARFERVFSKDSSGNYINYSQYQG